MHPPRSSVIFAPVKPSVLPLLKGHLPFQTCKKRSVHGFCLEGILKLSFIHPGRLTWNIIIGVWKIMFLSKWVICRFHVNLPGCSNPYFNSNFLSLRIPLTFFRFLVGLILVEKSGIPRLQEYRGNPGFLGHIWILRVYQRIMFSLCFIVDFHCPWFNWNSQF